MKNKHLHFEQVIQALRTDVHALGLNKAARVSGLSPGALHRFVQPTVQPQASTVHAIARGLGYAFRLIRVAAPRPYKRTGEHRPSIARLAQQRPSLTRPRAKATAAA